MKDQKLINFGKKTVLFMMLIAVLSLTGCIIQPTEKTYTVTFNSNGGSTVNHQTVKSGAYATEPNCTREGYDLEGWYTKQTDGEKFDFSTHITKNITLYAHWKEKTSL